MVKYTHNRRPFALQSFDKEASTPTASVNTQLHSQKYPWPGPP
ncbi:hypothetical protein [Telluribacter sp.]|nr:hypothetical protein [Telluribacter sp.]